MEQKIVHVVSIDGQEHMQLVDTGPGGLVPANSQLIHIPGSATTGLVETDLDQEVNVSRVMDGTNQVAVLASVAANTTSINRIHTVTVSIRMCEINLIIFDKVVIKLYLFSSFGFIFTKT